MSPRGSLLCWRATRQSATPRAPAVLEGDTASVTPRAPAVLEGDMANVTPREPAVLEMVTGMEGDTANVTPRAPAVLEGDTAKCHLEGTCHAGDGDRHGG